MYMALEVLIADFFPRRSALPRSPFLMRVTVSTFAVPLGLSSQVSGNDVCEYFWFAGTLSDLLGCAHFLWSKSCAHLAIQPHAKRTPSHPMRHRRRVVMAMIRQLRSNPIVKSRQTLARPRDNIRKQSGLPSTPLCYLQYYDITILQNGHASYVHIYIYTQYLNRTTYRRK